MGSTMAVHYHPPQSLCSSGTRRGGCRVCAPERSCLTWATQCRCSQLKSLLVVIFIVPIFQLLQDPIQHCRSLFLRGLCGRWQRGEKTQRGLNSEGEAEVWGGHKESGWGIGEGRENTRALVSPVSARRLSLASPAALSYPHHRAKDPLQGASGHLRVASFLPARGLANSSNSWAEKLESAPFLWQPWAPRVWLSGCKQISQC